MKKKLIGLLAASVLVLGFAASSSAASTALNKVELPPVYQAELPPVYKAELPPVYSAELPPVYSAELPPVY
ncbi:hypothetical protein [Bacillus sp. P14.5]|uniref:hypothetical protein n=1 Tax=Bacillus sp. P14.5 TaxID=1983400 RepID=UPI000DEB7302|nr:hypothetical protein [Bacillus sp. P14.5]